MIGSRQSFGNNWTDVVAAWCLGQSLSLPDETAWEALGVLEQLWPEYLDKLFNRGIRGWTLIADAVDIGLALATCQKLKGFEGIQKRLRGGDQDVLPEIRFATALVGLGYEPILDEPYNGHRLDALI
ncbi:MAG: hypothetical protein JOZ71_07455, partial [Ktedonobacteraceae bacterium]|nr:hypothetical protein [Ktedonobacteraceae bacterium]